MATALLDAALEARRVRGPVLWQHGTADQLVPLEGTRRLIERFDGAEVQTRHYPDARHEIFNETNRDEVLADTSAFIAAVVDTSRLSGTGESGHRGYGRGESEMTCW